MWIRFADERIREDDPKSHIGQLENKSCLSRAPSLWDPRQLLWIAVGFDTQNVAVDPPVPQHMWMCRGGGEGEDGERFADRISDDGNVELGPNSSPVENQIGKRSGVE